MWQGKRAREKTLMTTSLRTVVGPGADTNVGAANVTPGIAAPAPPSPPAASTPGAAAATASARVSGPTRAWLLLLAAAASLCRCSVCTSSLFSSRSKTIFTSESGVPRSRSRT